MPESDTKPTTLVGFCVRGTARCDGCDNRFPIGGFAPRLACPTCGEIREISADQWAERLAALKRTILLKPGAIEGLYDGGGTILKFGWNHPGCPHCGRRLPPAEELENQLVAGFIGCPHCRTPVALRPAGPLEAAIHPEARFVIGETLSPDGSLEVQRSTEPVVINCSHCAGALSIDGAARTVSCTYCQADNYLPDGLWQRLNPAPKSHFIFLIAAVSARKFDRAQGKDRGDNGDQTGDEAKALAPPSDAGATDDRETEPASEGREDAWPDTTSSVTRATEPSSARRLVPLALGAAAVILAFVLLALTR